MHAKSLLPRGLTILELLVTMFVIGVVVAIVLPAICTARESSRRMTCVNNLRELGLALHSHHDSKSSFPAGWQFDPSGQTAYGWVVPLLPYLGQPDLRDAIDMAFTIGDSRNRIAGETTLSQMLCPSDIVEPSFTLFESDDDHNRTSESSLRRSIEPTKLLQLPTSNYVGLHGTIEPVDHEPTNHSSSLVADGAFRSDLGIRLLDFQRGLSNTFLVGERKMAQASSTWYGFDRRGEDASARLVGATLDGINQAYGEECDFSSRHPGGAHFLYGDGHVRFVSEQIELRLYLEQARVQPNGQN